MYAIKKLNCCGSRNAGDVQWYPQETETLQQKAIGQGDSTMDRTGSILKTRGYNNTTRVKNLAEVLIVWAYNLLTSIYHVSQTQSVFSALVRKTRNDMRQGNNI